MPPAGGDLRLAIEGLRPGTLVQVETKEPEANGGPTKIPPSLLFPSEDIVVLKSVRNERTETATVFVPDAARHSWPSGSQIMDVSLVTPGVPISTNSS